MTDEREIIAWSCNREEEHLTYDDMDDAIEAYLDDFGPTGERTPKTVTVYGFARMELKRAECRVLADLLERLDEEYGDPDGDWGVATTAMEEAEKHFIDVVLAEYCPWACEAVKEVTVDTNEWIKEHRPNWIKEKP